MGERIFNHSVDDGNPANHLGFGCIKPSYIAGYLKFAISTGEFAGFLNHQPYGSYGLDLPAPPTFLQSPCKKNIMFKLQLRS